MYSIKYKHKDASTEYYLYRTGDQEYCLTSGSLSMEMGKAGELKISLPMTNPAIDNIVCLSDEFIVYRDNVEIWRGRPITGQQDFELTGTLTCEGILSYFYDTYYPPFEFQGTPANLLRAIVTNHNSFVSSDKQFQVGNITVADRNDYINRSSEEYLRTIEVLSSRFVESSLGGYFRARVQGGVKYLDYLGTYATTATQNITFGENILDLATEIEYGDAITAVLPLGARLKDSQGHETDERLTVASVNGGDIYVRNSSLVSSRGFISELVIWDDVTVASNLLTKARNYLSQASSFIQKFTVKAIDLHWADASITAWKLGDSVRVVSNPHGVNQYSELYKMNLDLLDPSNDSYEFGITRTSNSLTGRTSSTTRNIKDSLSSLTTNFHKIAADYASIEYLSANYATIVQLDATNANITNLQADVAEIDSALVTKADIADLTATNANVSNLTASYANIHNLLSGNAGIGDLQTIHLTSSNAVIDASVLRTVLANNITVNDLMAGDIITNRQRIISNDGSFEIDGSTQTIKDEYGNVRIQIGRDANDEFTFVLYDANGTGVLIDADGIHESAIGNGLIKDSMVANNANIQATKLDIASLFTAINADGSNTIYANKIWLSDANQTLNQAYSSLTTSITAVAGSLSEIEADADAAYSMAEQATRAADQATRALEGLTSLDNLTAILTNDAHVVHTYYDGTGGDYSYAVTQVRAYKGDAEVTDRASISVYAISDGVTGTFNTSTHTYQVTNLSTMNGYVDFEISYGEESGYLTLPPDAARLKFPDGALLKLGFGTATVHKRFSISKSPDGMAGTSWKIQSSAGVIRRTQDGTALNPPSVTFTAIQSVGEIATAYSGKYRIEETADYSTWAQKYYSDSVEERHVYVPTLSAKMIRVSLYNANDGYLDSQTLTVIADADELQEELRSTQQVIQTVSNRVTNVETGIDGLQVQIDDVVTQYSGVVAESLLFQTPYRLGEDGDTCTFEVRLYKAGEDIHTNYDRRWFQWYRKTETGTEMLGTGYSMQVRKSDMGYGGTIVCRFTSFGEDGLLILPDGYSLLFPDENRLKMYGEGWRTLDCETDLFAENALLNRFTSVDTQFNVTNGKIAAVISESDIAEYQATGTTMNTKLSAVVQDIDSIYAQVSSLETTQEGTISRVAQLEIDTDNIASSVVYRNSYTGEVIASLINQSASSVSISAQAIDLTGYVTMTNLQTAGQTTINGSNITTGTITDAGGNTSFNLTTGALTMNKGSINIGSGVFKVTTAGALTATNATINGKITATSGSIGGINISSSSIASSNGRFSVTSAGVLTATDTSLQGTFTTTSGGYYTRITSNKISCGAYSDGTYTERGYIYSTKYGGLEVWAKQDDLVLFGYDGLGLGISRWSGTAVMSMHLSGGTPLTTFNGNVYISNLQVSGGSNISACYIPLNTSCTSVQHCKVVNGIIMNA